MSQREFGRSSNSWTHTRDLDSPENAQSSAEQQDTETQVPCQVDQAAALTDTRIHLPYSEVSPYSEQSPVSEASAVMREAAAVMADAHADSATGHHHHAAEPASTVGGQSSESAPDQNSSATSHETSQHDAVSAADRAMWGI